MNRQFISTEDGSTTLYVLDLNEHYHSIHGAVQESLHIFIRAGLEFREEREHRQEEPLRILEAGFGTGLNAYLTLLHTLETGRAVVYDSFEKYPLTPEEAARLNYREHIPSPHPELFARLHASPWEEAAEITPLFTLRKHCADFREINFPPQFDLVYFDAFNPDVQPHLWTEEVFRNIHTALKPGGIFVTYCVKGIVKQALRNVGFTLRRLPGPPGKREMLRATKQEQTHREACPGEEL